MKKMTAGILLAYMTAFGNATPILTVSFTSGEQTVIAGQTQVSFGAYVLDATQSSEDIRVTAIAGDYRFNEANRGDDLVKFTLYDGIVPITTGVNISDPLQFGTQTLIPDTSVVVPKGTVKTIQQRVDVRNGTTGIYQWSVPENRAGMFSAVGMASANAATVTIAPTSGIFTLNVIPYGEVVIEQEYTPAISESGNGNVFFSFSILPTGEAFSGGTLTFAVQVSPASRFQFGNGLAHPRLGSDTVSIESVLVLFQEKGDVTSYLVSFNLVSGFTFPPGSANRFAFTMEYDNALQTGDEVTVSFAGNNPEFTGAISGVQVTPSVPTGTQTVVIRRVPQGAVGDADKNGTIGAGDLKRMIIALKVWRASSSQPMPAALFPELNAFPDEVIDHWDVAALDAYLKGLFLTLPVGDVNYDWKFTTADIGLARAGILGTRLIRNFQVRQADINQNGVVTTLDIALMRRLILGLGIGR